MPAGTLYGTMAISNAIIRSEVINLPLHACTVALTTRSFACQETDSIFSDDKPVSPAALVGGLQQPFSSKTASRAMQDDSSAG